jgi:hypothetical protein
LTCCYTDDIVWKLYLKDGNEVNEGEAKLTAFPNDIIDYFELIKGLEIIERIDLKDKHINLIFTRRRILSESTCETIIIVGWIIDDVKEITWIYPDGTSETEDEWGSDVIHAKVNPL